MDLFLNTTEALRAPGVVPRTFQDAAIAAQSRRGGDSIPGNDAVMSMFCELLCKMISAHHILPASSVSSVSCCHFLWCRPRHSVTLLLPWDISQKCLHRFSAPHKLLSLFLFTLSLFHLPISFSLSAFAFVGEWKRAVSRPPLVVPHRVGHAETLPRTPHPPGVWRLCWHHTALLCSSATKLRHRYEILSLKGSLSGTCCFSESIKDALMAELKDWQNVKCYHHIMCVPEKQEPIRIQYLSNMPEVCLKPGKPNQVFLKSAEPLCSKQNWSSGKIQLRKNRHLTWD